MNALTHSKSGYAAGNTSLRPLRSLEYEALARVTRRLTSAWAQRKSDFPSLAVAMNENLALWRLLALDVAEPGNSLPAPLRAQLFYLFEFADQHSEKVLRNEASVEVLVDINTAVMRGLRGEGGGR